MAEFVHLHVHSEYSMLDASIRLKSLVSRVKELGMPAVALTDHGSMFGAVQLTKLAKDAGIKPIIGCEVNVVRGDRRDKKPRQSFHLVLLARGAEGYANLVRIVSRGWVEGADSGLPRVDFEVLRDHHKGIVALTGCMGGLVAQDVLQKGKAAGRTALGELTEIFEKGSLFVEIQDHGFLEDKPLTRTLVQLARETDLPLVASNDCHYLHKSDARAQKVLQCIAAGMQLTDYERSHHGSDVVHLRSQDEMSEVFAEFPDAIRNTLRVSEMCAGTASPLAAPKLPRFPVPAGTTEPDYFKHLAGKGLEVRIAEELEMGRKVNAGQYRQRLEMECDVISRMGFAGYFLIVQDFINWGKQNGVPVGPGRGSGAGSIAAWALRITDLDPIPYGLLFERFLNPDRVSMPDFDIDFCMDRRDRVINYVRERYGTTSVGQIATFHQLKSRSVVRDVGRAFGWAPGDAGRIATMIPEPVQGKTVSIAKALEQEAQLKALYTDDQRTKELIDTAQSLEDLTRHAGMHAAGVVISEGPLWDHVPVFCPEENTYVTQFHKDDVEYAGLVKFDFLGLKTLTVIDIAASIINKRPDRQGQTFRIDRIPINDKATFALLQSGETTGVFQLESSGMQDLFKKLRPDCLEDIIAAISLYRPGPMELIPEFIQRKHGKAKIAYPHACLEKILKETYGVIVYQEQVMQAAQEMAGYSLGGADLLRRAMGKKKLEEMAKQKETFVTGAVARGHAADDASSVFDLIEKFAGYGFNKSHAAAYALISYQTAYLKTHYPVEFMCASLTADKDKIDKVVRTVAESREMGIVVLPPDVNESEIDFSVVYAPAPDASIKRKKDSPVCVGGKVRDPLGPKIRFGLGAVKGMGSAALETVFESRNGTNGGDKRAFRDIYDFCERVDVRRVNKGVMEALVQCGAFDAVHKHFNAARAQVFAVIDTALERGRRRAQERDSGQTSLFGLMMATAPEAAMAAERRTTEFPAVEPWDVHETLVREKQTLGFYISGHPLDRYATELRRVADGTTATVAGMSDGHKARIGGTVEGYRERPTKAGKKMAFFYLEDGVGRVEVIVRPRVLESVSETLKSGQVVLVSGTVQIEADRAARSIDEEGNEVTVAEAKLLLEEVSSLSSAVRTSTRSVRVKLGIDRVDRDKLIALKNTLTLHPGGCPVTLELRSNERWSVSLPSTGLSVEPSEKLLSDLERLFGEKVAELR